jgi:hypothetical protein
LDKYRKAFFANDDNDIPTVFTLHPLGAGHRQFFTVSWFRWRGLEINNNKDMMTMAHLYRVALAESQCATFPDMDFVVNSQTNEHIFYGGLPTTFEQRCFKTGLTMGLSIQSQSTAGLMKPLVTRSGKGHSPRWLVASDIRFTTIFAVRCLGSHPQDVERTAEDLEVVLNAALHGIDRSKFKTDFKGKLVHRAELMKLTIWKPKPTFRQLLVALEDNLMQEAPIL